MASSIPHLIHGNFAQYGFKGKLYAINMRGLPAHGLPGFASCRDLPAPVDSAYFHAPVEGLIDAAADAGAEGAALQEKHVKVAREHDMSLLGPNSLGFASFSSSTAITPVPPPHLPLLVGRVGIISQSGAYIRQIAAFGLRTHIGLSFMAALGNETMLGVADLMDYFIHDDATRAIAKDIRDTAAFARIAAKAASACKPAVIMKVGKSALTAQMAASHTGAIVGDDRIFDEACARYGVIRAESIESLITTAGLAVHLGRLEKPGVGVLSISGGACGIIADQAETDSMPFCMELDTLASILLTSRPEALDGIAVWRNMAQS